MSYQWAVASRPKQGQSISGDASIVHVLSDGRLTAAVIDGLGGGEEAALAATRAIKVIEEHPEWGLQELTKSMHTALHHTRGAVSGLLRLEPESRRLSFVGVGNIGVHVYSRQPIKPISKSGILGFRFPTLLELSYTYNHGDTVVLYSDGISSRFGQDTPPDLTQPLQQIADRLLEFYGKPIDDATVLVIKSLPS